jgi:hypothetical protein
MDPAVKPDWDEACRRMEAWWHGEVIDRVCLRVSAPLAPAEPFDPAPVPPEDLDSYWLDPERVVERQVRGLAGQWWGAESFPVMFPVSVGIPAITAAYLGSPVEFVGTTSAWCHPIIEDWDDCPTLRFDPQNEWFRRSVALLRTACERAEGRYVVGLPDLNGPGEILSRLRGPENLAIDLIENPERVHDAMRKVNRGWLEVWRALTGVVREYADGYVYWMRHWSALPSTDLQTDFSIMISQRMFDEFFLPYLAEQTEWVGRTIYHLDGPGAARHLDSLLSLPKLTGVQWTPGAGAPSMSHWIDLLRRVQAAGKLLFLWCNADEVEPLLTKLRPEGLFLVPRCATVDEGRAVIRLAERMAASR